MKDLVRDISSRFFRQGADELGGEIPHALKRMSSKTKDRHKRKEELQQRLEELVILEIRREGERRYFNFTVRQLYNLVIKSITKPTSISYSDNSFTFAPLGPRRFSVAGETIDENSSTLRRRERSASLARIELLQASDLRAKKKEHVTYRERLGGHLHPRDMRRLVIPFSATNEPELIVRRHVMLLNFDPFRAIVLRDRLFVIVPEGADSILETLEARVQGLVEEEYCFNDAEFPPTDPDTTYSERTFLMPKKTLESTHKQADPEVAESEHTPLIQKQTSESSSVPQVLYTDSQEHNDFIKAASLGSEDDEDLDRDEIGHIDSDEIEEIEAQTFVNLPFELQCVDAVLHSAVDLLSCQVDEILDSTQQAMDQLLKPETGIGSLAQEMLRTSKNNVHEMLSQVQGFLRAVTQVLNEDEDMALMNLSRLITHPERFIQPVSRAVLEEESDEPELILESYLQQAVTLCNVVRAMERRVQTTEELVTMKSDTIRNRILYANMLLSMSSLAVAIVSAVGGIFGMNLPLPDHLSDNPTAFVTVVVLSSLGGLFLIIIVLFLLKMSGVLSAAVADH